MINIIL